MTTNEQTLPPGDRFQCHESVHIDMRRRAALAEREAIIAWLRTLPGDKGGTVTMSVGRSFGDRIERGEHAAD